MEAILQEQCDSSTTHSRQHKKSNEWYLQIHWNHQEEYRIWQGVEHGRHGSNDNSILESIERVHILDGLMTRCNFKQLNDLFNENWINPSQIVD